MPDRDAVEFQQVSDVGCRGPRARRIPAVSQGFPHERMLINLLVRELLDDKFLAADRASVRVALPAIPNPRILTGGAQNRPGHLDLGTQGIGWWKFQQLFQGRCPRPDRVVVLAGGSTRG